jgi:hypothetical protein
MNLFWTHLLYLYFLWEFHLYLQPCIFVSESKIHLNHKTVTLPVGQGFFRGRLVFSYIVTCECAQQKKAGLPPIILLASTTSIMMMMRGRLPAISGRLTRIITRVVMMSMMTVLPLFFTPFHIHSKHLCFIAMTHFHVTIHMM